MVLPHYTWHLNFKSFSKEQIMAKNNKMRFNYYIAT